MYRSMYDVDCVTWSPQGRIFQVEYAMEAVKQGTCCVGVRSRSYAVLCSLKKSVSKLAYYHQKVFQIDDYLGVAMSGITADAKMMADFMRNECLHHKFVYDAPLAIGRLTEKVADKCQIATQRYSKRPYGVGILLAGYDKTGPHIFETCPSGNFFESYAMAFGARSQSSKTYLERNLEFFDGVSLDDLLLYGVKALGASLQQDLELTIENICVGVVGENMPWRELRTEEIKEILNRITAQSAEVPDVEMASEETQQA